MMGGGLGSATRDVTVRHATNTNDCPAEEHPKKDGHFDLAIERNDVGHCPVRDLLDKDINSLPR